MWDYNIRILKWFVCGCVAGYFKFRKGTSVSNRNEYQEPSCGVKGGRRVRLTTLPPSVSRLSRQNVGASTSHNPMGPHGLLQGQLYLYLSTFRFYEREYVNQLSDRLILSSKNLLFGVNCGFDWTGSGKNVGLLWAWSSGFELHKTVVSLLFSCGNILHNLFLKYGDFFCPTPPPPAFTHALIYE
jgi:hypothetical protein